MDCVLERAKNADRQNWIDALKGIAICGVIMIHSGASGLPSILGMIGSIGNSGVQLFFLLTAYLSFVSFEKHVKTHGYAGKSNVVWIKKKFIRLIPLYYLALLIYSGGAKLTFGNILAHIAFAHGLFPHYVNSFFGEWYLGVIAIFYVLVPLFFRWISSLEKSVIWFCLSSILCGCFSLIGSYVWTMSAQDEVVYNYINLFCGITQFPVIVLGIMIYHLLESGILQNASCKKTLSYTLLLFSICLIGGMMLGHNRISGLSGYTLFGISFCLLTISQKLNSCVFIDNRIFRYLGKHSYPIYLFHYFFIRLYNQYVPEHTGNATLNWFVKYATIVVLSLTISVLLEKYYDGPIVQTLKRLGTMKNKKKKVIVYMDGGICSQIWQYTIGQALAKRGFDVEYDLLWYWLDGHDLNGKKNRRFDLLRLSPDMSFRKAGYIKSRFYRKKYYSKKILIPLADKSYLGGYYDLSQEYLESIRTIISINPVMNELNKHFLQKICKCEHSVGVHVRRGDMTQEGYYWKVLSPEYYIKAMKLFPDATFYFFSDDMDWVEKNIICRVPHLRCEKVDCNADDQGYLDLALLVNCRGFICSSGSLGKFGALLAVKPPERVVVPEGTEQIWIDTLDNCMML